MINSVQSAVVEVVTRNWAFSPRYSIKLIFVYNFLLNVDRKEFENHKVGHVVTVKCCDVCKEGFGLSQVADAGTCITTLSKNRLRWNRGYRRCKF